MTLDATEREVAVLKAEVVLIEAAEVLRQLQREIAEDWWRQRGTFSGGDAGPRCRTFR